MSERSSNRILHGFFSTLVLAALATAPARATEPSAPAAALSDAASRLLASYPDWLARVEGNDIVWHDDTRMPLDDGAGVKPFGAWLAAPDIEDMFRLPYPVGTDLTAPAPEFDPGRARNEAFFAKMYGDCRKGGLKGKLRPVVWLPKKSGQRIEVATANGVAERLEAVSRELDALDARFDKFLIPSAGTYNCRVIAGTDRVSAHGYGIAIDIAVAQSDYWRWAAKGPAAEGKAPVPYQNDIPREIVDIFERHGFIWGGRWYHYDTMHFEYRPELLPPLAPLPEIAGAPAKPAADPGSTAPKDRPE